MYYRLKDNIALRKWRYVDRAIYIRGNDHALSVSKEEFELLLLCDGKHDIEPNPYLATLLSYGYIEQCKEGDEPSNWSK